MKRAWIVAMILATAACDTPSGGGGNDGGTGDAGHGVPDADGDAISDEAEGRGALVDTDGDGVPDYIDGDSDGDGIPDLTEAGTGGNPARDPADSDSDGTPDFRDLDSDNNGIADADEGFADSDGDGRLDFADWDNDGDNLSDTDEIGPDPREPVDTDGDGRPDYLDVDSDADTIGDVHEGSEDTDGDGTLDRFDADSDDDGLTDAAEAGDSDPATAPADSDLDGIADFRDPDSDNDGLADSRELEQGTSPTSTDSDSDGVSDLVEVAAGTNPLDGSESPRTRGDFVFEVPYREPPVPEEDNLDFSTDVSQADVVFAMDTTGSMGGEIDNLRASVADLIRTIRDSVPNAGFAVVGYEDFPDGGGVVTNEPYYIRHRVMTTNTVEGLRSIDDQVDSYTTFGASGGDGPETGWEMLYQVMSGEGTDLYGASVPAFDPATAHPATPPAGESVGELPGVGFREGSLPIVVWITDAPNHDPGVPGAATSDDAVGLLVDRSARVIGVVSAAPEGDPLPDITRAVTETDTFVAPEAWGSGGARPSGCSEGECCTGLLAAGADPDSRGRCPLIFNISAAGTGLGDAVAQAVVVLTSFGTLDISAAVSDDPSDAVDALDFVDSISPTTTAPAPCASGLTVEGNGFLDVLPGTTVCFVIDAAQNDTVPPTDEPQLFMATVSVWGDEVTLLDERDVYFLVPPVVRDPGAPD